LRRNLRRGADVLDYGCGSGILAIAAVKLGAGNVVGIDIDPQAIVASRDNATRNGVGARFVLASDLAASDIGDSMWWWPIFSPIHWSCSHRCWRRE
jgi:ribosomal protein L11 methylase PrmA